MNAYIYFQHFFVHLTAYEIIYWDIYLLLFWQF